MRIGMNDGDLLYYDVLPDAVHILRVFNAARKLEDIR
jgi:hypothetical protein